MKSIRTILLILAVTFTLYCDSEFRRGANIGTISTKIAAQDVNLQLEPKGSRWYTAKKLIDQSDCDACHRPFQMLTAPPYIMIAKRYNAANTNVSRLANRIINGSYGVWKGYTTMNNHPKLSQKEAQIIAKYILAFSQKR